MISIEEIEILAELSRIKLTVDEKIKFQKEIGAILEYVNQIKGVSSNEQVLEKKSIRNVMRNDSGSHQSGEYTEAILKNAVDRKGNYLKVKKIL